MSYINRGGNDRGVATSDGLIAVPRGHMQNRSPENAIIWHHLASPTQRKVPGVNPQSLHRMNRVSGNRAIAGARWKRAVPGAVTSAGHYSQVSDLGKVLVRRSNSADVEVLATGCRRLGRPRSVGRRVGGCDRARREFRKIKSSWVLAIGDLPTKTATEGTATDGRRQKDSHGGGHRRTAKDGRPRRGGHGGPPLQLLGI